MKMKKILSVVAAFALSISAFSTVAMAEEGKYGDPKVTVNFVKSGSYLDLEVGYTGFENFLAYANNRGSITGKGIGAFEITFAYDSSKVQFDGGEKKISVGLTEVAPSGSAVAKIGGTYTGDATQTAATNAHIATLWFTLLDENFDPETDSIDFEVTKIEFTVCDLSGATEDQLYGNVNVGSVPVELQTFTYGTASKPTITPVAMDAGVEVESGIYAGYTSVSAPEVVAVTDFAKITIENDVDTSKTLEWSAPTSLGDGKSNVLAVLLFNKATASGTFTIKFLNAASEAVKIFTHTVTE